MDDQGRVYFASNPRDQRLRVFGPDQTLLSEWGDLGTSTGEYGPVSGLAVDVEGNVYVADGARVQIFTRAGAFVRELGNTWRP